MDRLAGFLAVVTRRLPEQPQHPPLPVRPLSFAPRMVGAPEDRFVEDLLFRDVLSSPVNQLEDVITLAQE